MKKILTQAKLTKKIFFFLAFLLFLNTSIKSQNYEYKKFVDTNKLWVFEDQSRCWGQYPEVYYKFKGDTIIKNITYKKLLKSVDTMKTWYFSRIYKEDSLKRIYSYNTLGNGLDEIELDFNFNIGDTFCISTICNLLINKPLILDSICYIKFNGDNFLRKIYYFKQNNNQMCLKSCISMIESLGFTIIRYFNDPMLPDYLGGCGIFLKYYYENDTLKYSKDNIYPGYNCKGNDSIVGIKTSKKKPNLNIYPNPASDRIFINANVDDKIKEINVYTIFGGLVTSVMPNNDNSIDISNLKQGVYIIELRTENNVLRQKFIKE